MAPLPRAPPISGIQAPLGAPRGPAGGLQAVCRAGGGTQDIQAEDRTFIAEHGARQAGGCGRAGLRACRCHTHSGKGLGVSPAPRPSGRELEARPRWEAEDPGVRRWGCRGARWAGAQPEGEGEALGTHWSGQAESQEGGGEALGPRGWLGGRRRLLRLRGQG